jgi:hypothetical protein
MAETLVILQLQTGAGLQPFYGVFDGTANVLCSQSFIGGAPVTLANPLLVNSKPLPFNIITLNASQVVTANEPIFALLAGQCLCGGSLITQDPDGFYVNQAGTAGTAQSGSTFFYGPNEECKLVPSNGAVSVNATAAPVTIQGYGLT